MNCKACNKVYSTKQNLKKHWERQPLCEQWIKLQTNPGLKSYIDHKLSIEKEKQNQEKNVDKSFLCMACKSTFSNIGNLNRHISTNDICNKWIMYQDLKEIDGYLGIPYSTFEAPKYSLSHIIWNVHLIDKEFAKKPEMKKILEDNNTKYIIAILPRNETENKWLEELGVEVFYLHYEDHNMFIDKEAFDIQCKKIEEYRSRRENVFVFCNNGYQRSIPFLTYYLTEHHKDEIPNIERAVDIILSQVDKQNYSTYREKYITELKALFTK